MKESIAREIIAVSFSEKTSSDQCGFIIPIAEVVDDQLKELDSENFCPTMKVFITSGYSDLDEKFSEGKLFKIKVRISEKQSDKLQHTDACKYVATFHDAESVKPKDYFEVVKHPLPDPNDRLINLPYRPTTNYIYLEDDYIYGPFKVETLRNGEDDGVYSIGFIDLPLPGVKTAQFQTYQIEKSKIDPNCVPLSGSRKLLYGFSFLTGSRFYEYISDEEVIRFCGKVIGDNNTKVIEKSRIEGSIKMLMKNATDLLKSRMERFSQLVEQVEGNRENLSRDIGQYLKSEIGKKFVAENLVSFQDEVVTELTKQNRAAIDKKLQDLIVEEKKTLERINELKQQRNEIFDEINAQQKKGAQNKVSNIESIAAEKNEKIASLSKHENELSEKIKNLQAELGELAIKHADVLNFDKIQDDLSYFSRKKDELTKQTENIQSLLFKNNAELSSRLTELKPFVDAIMGSGEALKQQDEPSVSVTQLPSKTNWEAQEVVDALTEGLSSRGRSLTEIEVANLLVLTQQSFLTIIAGLPGTGKTSLSRLLPQAMGAPNRLWEVAVSRGWSSKRDLIGAYNSLLGKFQPASSGLYQYLSALSKEQDSKSSPMSYVLLDEANLSPIEHYWSDFIALTDTHEQRQRISLNPHPIEIPESLRFIATINYDGTTETLSPRLLDRAPIVVLSSAGTEFGNPANLLSLTGGAERSESDALFPIPAGVMQNLFGRSTRNTKSLELTASEDTIYKQIIEILGENNPHLGSPISISPRKREAVLNYCAKARNLMNSIGDTTAIDYGLNQLILPQIRGNGPRFQERLRKLHSVLSNHQLEQSTKTVDRIISNGEIDLLTFDFFSF